MVMLSELSDPIISMEISTRTTSLKYCNKTYTKVPGQNDLLSLNDILSWIFILHSL